MLFGISLPVELPSVLGTQHFSSCCTFCWFRDSCEGVCENSTPHTIVSQSLPPFPFAILGFFCVHPNRFSKSFAFYLSCSCPPDDAVVTIGFYALENPCFGFYSVRICRGENILAIGRFYAGYVWQSKVGAGGPPGGNRSRERTTGSPLLSRISARPEAPTSEV